MNKEHACQGQWLTETDAVTVLRQSRSIVPVSAWLTESKPSCFSCFTIAAKNVTLV